MVINRGEMKRKRREECRSPLLDDSPKRTKVHAQRKFAQGSNVNSPVITPVKEIERQDLDVLPEPVELLPIKRPNTEDFLTFLCFRGTPILPPNLNFFNTASIVDTNGQVHEIKSESPKNGPIDTSVITKSGAGSSERPFVAFGVRKRADPIVISRQMDRKRRHALALQALRRKYQEQKMAKIRAVTISKLSEKIPNKALLRSNSVSKSESTTKRTTAQKSKEIESDKITTRSRKPILTTQLKQKMCLRSFSGRFVQKELQFRSVKKRNATLRSLAKRPLKKQDIKENEEYSDYSSEDDKPLVKTSKDVKISPKVILTKITKKSAGAPTKPLDVNSRITRSSKFLGNKMVSRRQQIKQRLLLTTPKTIVKPRTLRSHSKPGKLLPVPRQKVLQIKLKREPDDNTTKDSPVTKKSARLIESAKKDSKDNLKGDVNKIGENLKKELRLTECIKKSTEKPAEERLTENPSTLDKLRSGKTIYNKNKIEKKSTDKSNIPDKFKTDKKLKLDKLNSVPDSSKPGRILSLASDKLKSGKTEVFEKVKTDKKIIEKKKPDKKSGQTLHKGKIDSSKINKNIQLDKVKLTGKNQRSILNKLDEGFECGTSITDKNFATKIKNDKNSSDKSKNDQKKSVCDKKEVVGSPTLEKYKIEKNSICDKMKNARNLNIDRNLAIDKCKSEKISPKREIDFCSDVKSLDNPKPEILNLLPINKSLELARNISQVYEATIKKESLNKTPQTSKSERSNETKRERFRKEDFTETRSQRPSRKTKEAAAIYMEILSHKLVNESKIDDDNVSIDSFPELPNVKKTEQRENELKAKARCVKQSDHEVDKKPSKVKDEIEESITKNLKLADKKKETQKKNELVVIEKGKEAHKKNEAKEVKIENMRDFTTKTEIVSPNSDSKQINPTKTLDLSQTHERKSRLSNIERNDKNFDKENELHLKVQLSPIELKSDKKIASKSETQTLERKLTAASMDETVETETFPSLKKSKDKKICVLKSKDMDKRRQTRNSSHNIKQVVSDDSDESFHVDVIIPRKKQLTRSKARCENDTVTEINKHSNKYNPKRTFRKNDKDYAESSSSSDSDHSSTFDIKKSPTKNKKYTKTRSQQQIGNQSFSDSDEEPLSKLTQNRVVERKDDGGIKIGKTNEQSRSKDIKKDVATVDKDNFRKPIRECAKRPQNYLLMSSSSDEDEAYFQSYNKVESNKINKPKAPVKSCYASTSLDLSCKDIDRRFGKGRVNMSTEQIEKWLKESAMAGNSVKSENDAMLKFGEKIPTETSHPLAALIDTEKLKTLLVEPVDKSESEKNVQEKVAKGEDITNSKISTSKPSLVDRKLIFRNKDKINKPFNTNAFSVSNESSVYAFGEEAEIVTKTPFRRPSRRPSSTATSRSEDESSKMEESSTGKGISMQFRKPPLIRQDSTKSVHDTSDEIIQTDADESFNTPIQPVIAKPKTTLSNNPQSIPSTSMVAPQKVNNLKHLLLKQNLRGLDKNLDSSDDFKYRIPSSPSASSSSSAKLSKRQSKLRASEILPIKLPDFPAHSNYAQLVEAPTFHPTDKEFQDPLEYIEKIRLKGEQFGICRIVPPPNFKPECKVTDDMRFTAYNQYVHKMLHRWGPNFKELMAIQKYLSTQNISLTHPPWIGGMEIDLPRLYQTVQSLGGLKEVIEKKKWPKVSDAMKIPKSAQDRVTKLDDIYCKYLLPYDTLSPAEREKLFDEVETEWAKRESKSLLKAQQNIKEDTNEEESDSDDEAEECIVKGRSMALNAFYRIARNTMSMWFKTAVPSAEEVEQEFWKHVINKQNHICVHSGSIDSGNWGYGFAITKNSPFARHAWNLKVLTNNSGSVLRSMGPLMGVTVPTLHVGMVFSSCCWYRDPHSLPWIEYLHTGGNKIWYGIPNSTSDAFHTTMKTLVPNYCRNKSLWLPSDTVMVPPNILVENGVSLSRIVQQPGQFIVVFPKAFTSSISTGYVVSESVYFAPPSWLKTGRSVFNELRNSCEPPMFSFDRLLLSIVNDSRSNVDVLRQIIPIVEELCDSEKKARDKIRDLGVTLTEKLALPDVYKIRKKKKLQNDDGEYECEVCRMNLFVSMVTDSQEDAIYCIDHAIEQIENKKVQSKNCKLTFTYDYEELGDLKEKVETAITNKLQKKIPNKFAGLPTLLNK